MRGADKKSGSLFSYVDLEGRIPAKHPLRPFEVVLRGKVSRRSFFHQDTDMGKNAPIISVNFLKK